MSAPVIDPVKRAAERTRPPSVPPEDAGALDLLATELEKVGFTCRHMPFQKPGTDRIENLYAKVTRHGVTRDGSTGHNKPRHFCFAGHSDVVPVGRMESWSVDPFGGAIIDGH